VDTAPKLIIFLSGVACVTPPLPPDANRLVMNYTEGTIVKFGGIVNYTCQTGYFFEEDKNLPNFNLTCYRNGSIPTPTEWRKRCYHEGGEEIRKFKACVIDTNFSSKKPYKCCITNLIS
jgi:hypothetical protein